MEKKLSVFFLVELLKPFSVAVQFASIQSERAKVSGKLDIKCLLERNPNLIYSLQLEMNSVLYVHKHAWHCIVHVLYIVCSKFCEASENKLCSKTIFIDLFERE